MNSIIKTLGILITCFSFTMIPPIAIAFFYHETTVFLFSEALLATLIIGLLCWRPFMSVKTTLKTRDGFIVVTLFWVTISLFAAFPFFLSLSPSLSFTDAFFESVSGLTTTGATILAHLSHLSHSLLFYRQELHLLGGIGIVVLAVAVLPMLGVGGMQLYRAEIAGPMKQAKLTPRIAQTAKALWSIYAILIVACAIAYYVSGMNLFDAICESFSTISTGGFSIHDSSFAYYHSNTIELLAVVFMWLGAVNFSLHFRLLRERKLSAYWSDTECRYYFWLIIIVTIIVSAVLYTRHYYPPVDNFIHALFTVTAISTTTGLTINNISHWPSMIPYLLVFLSIIGGCAGSTAGGIKIIRALLLKEQAKRECYRLIHPRSVQSLQLGSTTLPTSVIQTMWGYLVLFLVVFVLLLLALLMTNIDFTTAFSALVACISNTGAGIAGIAGNYSHLHDITKWILIIAMFVGRLEIFTVIVLFMPAYWRR